MTARLQHIATLGVDAVWISPCFTSPQRDGGYDVADFLNIAEEYGTPAEFEAFVAAAHGLGLRVLLDIVPNHVSIDHAWFTAATRDASAPERARFIFRRGRSADVPPNNWSSVFGGSAWTKDGPDQWYLHSFDASQPDLNWDDPDVVIHFDEVLRHWFGRGVDGFRIDVAHGLVKGQGLPDWPGAEDGTGGHNYAQWDQPGVHEIYRRWRRLAESHPEGPRYLIGEIWVPSRTRLAAYLRPDELHHTFEFDLLVQPWSAGHFQSAITRILAEPALEGHVWTLSNHDVHRTVTRYGQQQVLEPPDPTDMLAAARRTGPVDLALGTARARAALMLMLALPGAAYLYQGEELGLPEVVDLPDDARTDPIWVRSRGHQLGRDGCRIPMPWDSTAINAGFSSAPRTWLPQPAAFRFFAADLQSDDPTSVLRHFQAVIAARRSLFGGDAGLTWLDAPADVLAWSRGNGVVVINFGESPVALRTDDRAPLASSATVEQSDGSIELAPNSGLWSRAAVTFTPTTSTTRHASSTDTLEPVLQSTTG